MKSFLITNLCTNVRIKTKDDHVLQAFSGFYQHVRDFKFFVFRKSKKKYFLGQDMYKIYRPWCVL